MMIYQFKTFNKKNIIQGISTRDQGTMKDEGGSVNKKNLRNFLDELGIADEGVCMEQIHDSNVGVVNNSDLALVRNIDGLITKKKNLPLVVVTADCIPIIFADTENSAIGIAHAGYKGLKKGIIKNILRKFKDEFGSDPANLVVGIGPSIEKKCYEVNGELIDIRDMAVKFLLKDGIKKEKIENINKCSNCAREFFSYRGGDGTKRFATVISMV